ncbi:MAG: histidine kinase [Steroidobacteraceae bacterium]|jgi:PAS domain S-box-containing protein|nr:histidine kinase [Steroidobacteraceae bacterium]
MSSERVAVTAANAEAPSLRLQIDGLRDFAIFMLDRAGRVSSWNIGAQRFQGYRADEIVGREISCFFLPDDIEAGIPQQNLECARREGHFEGEGWRLRKDGSKYWASVILTAMRGDDGEIVGFGKVVRDITERVRSVEQFRLAIEASPTGMLMMDESGAIVLVNEQTEKLFGYPRAELLGQKLEMLVPSRFRSRHPGFRLAFFADPKVRAMGAGRDLYGLRKDGSEIPIEIGLNPLTTSEGRFVLSSVVDITERKRSDRERETLLGQLQALNAELEERVTARTAELTATLREREVLLQEIHHRVKNNLQVISSLINMQLRQLEDSGSRDALEECQTRVQAIALIHEKLYQSKDYSRVPFSEYARGLAGNVFRALGVSKDLVNLELAFEELSLTVDKAIPCGLVLNELITNSLKHAFPDGRRGTVKVILRRDGAGHAMLCVSDDGVGIPPGVDPRNSASLGMSLVFMLVEQLGGSIDIQPSPGTELRMRFPIEAGS